MGVFGKLSKVMKSIRQLGFLPLFYLGLYRLGLLSGLWWALTPVKTRIEADSTPESETPLVNPVFSRLVKSTLQDFYNREPEAAEALLVEAEEILDGQVRLFGGPPRQLELIPPGDPRHWTAWANDFYPASIDPDIKLIWEPARFGWAFTLARAYVLTGEERFTGAFWHYFYVFREANPVNRGPNWASAQEIALRLISISFAGRILANAPSTTLEDVHALRTSIGEHAGRLSLTRVYALSQNNNHLLTESAGLVTAGVFLPEHPHAKKWLKEGWRWGLYALKHQIDPDGAYIQQSNNYHRLMLAAALWVQALGQTRSLRFPLDIQKRLAAAARWLEEQADLQSGQVPNLGSNDGANILPLSSGEFVDYRPTIQASSQRFLLKSPFPPGPWDEMVLWLELFRQRRIEFTSSSEIQERTLPRPEFRAGPDSLPRKEIEKLPASPHLIVRSDHSWASLRAVTFHNRPAHADQLHIDLWWRGINIACDAGSYRYNADPPWDNSLAGTAAHNTVTINGRDQMSRAGIFLWLDWCQARRLQADRYHLDEMIAQHDGYARFGCRHQRRLFQVRMDAWRVEDFILPLMSAPRPVKVCLHWLIRDYPWELSRGILSLSTPAGRVSLTTKIDVENPKSILQKEYRQVIRAGKLVVGRGEVDPILGWFSPTYDLKLPALSFRMFIEAAPPIRIVSEWTFSEIVNDL